MDIPPLASRWLRQLTTARESVRSFWDDLPSVWRWVWILIHAVTFAVFLRSFSWPDTPLPFLPAGLILAIVGTAGLASRAINEEWRMACPEWRTAWLAASAILPVLMLLGALLPRLSPAGAGGALAITLFCAFAAVFWTGLASPFAFEFRFTETGFHPDDELNERQESLPIESRQEGAITQSWQRTAPHPGVDCLAGFVQVRLDETQKLANVHLPFVPPFAKQPQVTCDVLSELPVRSSVAAIFPYGVRIELRRSGPELPAETIELHLTAIAADSPERLAS